MSEKTYEEFYEQQMSRRMKDGKIVRMYRPTRGWQYIRNTPQDINRALRQSYVPEDVATGAGVPLGPCGSHKGHDVPEVGAPGPARADDAPKPKRGPGRPRKTEDKDGE